jgi:hypothetical protein
MSLCLLPSWRSARVPHIQVNSSKFEQICANLSKFKQIQAKWRISWGTPSRRACALVCVYVLEFDTRLDSTCNTLILETLEMKVPKKRRDCDFGYWHAVWSDYYTFTSIPVSIPTHSGVLVIKISKEYAINRLQHNQSSISGPTISYLVDSIF